MTPLAWCVFLLFTTLVLLVLEILMPTGGVLGLMAAAASVAAVVISFREGPLLGLAVIASFILLTPMVIALATKLWPRTPWGKQIIQQAPTPDEVLPQTKDLTWMVGETGRVASRMMPSGIVEIGGQSWDALIVGEHGEPGDIVTIIRIEGRRLTVRKARLLEEPADLNDYPDALLTDEDERDSRP